jgi:hypothetical protein
MSSFDAKKEKQLAIYLKFISENPKVKITTLARKHHVSYDKLQRRI